MDRDNEQDKRMGSKDPNKQRVLSTRVYRDKRSRLVNLQVPVAYAPVLCTEQR